MLIRNLFRRLGALLVVSLFIIAFIPSIVVAAEQVILTWEQDADGNPIAVGQVIDDEYQSATGLSVTVQTVSGNDIAAIFPSHNPPVQGSTTIDPDLGSPNTTCPGGGPGIGAGGQVGQPGENCLSHNNVLIMPTRDDSDNDGFIDGNPDDDANGGTISFYFSSEVSIDFTEILDQESQESLTINSYADLDGTNLVDEEQTAGLGDNSYENIVIDASGVRRVDFVFMGSGAIASLAFTPEEPTAVNLSSFNASTAATGQSLLLVTVLMVLFTATGLGLFKLYNR